MHFLSLLFSFNGRINRSQYWLGCGLIFVGSFLAFTLAGLVAAPPAAPSKPMAQHSAGLAAYVLALPIWLISAWAGFAVQVKRFHDRGRSGFWSLLPLLPVTMMFASALSSASAAATLPQMFGAVVPWLFFLLAINLWFFVELGCLPGKEGPNKYDHTPVAGGSAGRAGPFIPGLPKAPPHAPQTSNSLATAELALERAITQQSGVQQSTPRPPSPSPTARSFGRRAAS